MRKCERLSYVLRSFSPLMHVIPTELCLRLRAPRRSINELSGVQFVVYLTGPERRAGIKVDRKSTVLAANSSGVRGILMVFVFKPYTHTHTHMERETRAHLGVTICKMIAVSMRGSKTGDGQYKTLLLIFYHKHS